MRLDMAYLPSIERFSHSRSHSLSGAFLALLMALLCVIPTGDVHTRFVASLAHSSAFSFPIMPWWAGHRFIVTVAVGFVLRKACVLTWKVCVNSEGALVLLAESRSSSCSSSSEFPP